MLYTETGITVIRLKIKVFIELYKNKTALIY